MAKISIDLDLCTGCGTCAELCPEVFELKDDKSHIIKQDANGCNLQDVVDTCPSQAIKVE